MERQQCELQVLELAVQNWCWRSSFLTKNQPQAISGSFNAPAGQIEPRAFFDEDAEAVRLKEQREEADFFSVQRL